MLNWSAEADHPLVPSSDSMDDADRPKILKESFDELHKAVKAAIDFHPEYKLRPTMVAIKSESLHLRSLQVQKGYSKASFQCTDSESLFSDGSGPKPSGVREVHPSH